MTLGVGIKGVAFVFNKYVGIPDVKSCSGQDTTEAIQGEGVHSLVMIL